jgi:3-oxoacyl-[acyl-carrier protein] reductase
MTIPSEINHTALITSAGRDPARTLALALAALGWRLALNDLMPQRLDETAMEAQALGAHVSTHIGDSSKGLFARGLVEEVLERWERIDLLVNCPLAEPRLPLLELDEWDFQRTLEANVHGPFLLMQLVGNWMRNERHRGMILNLITSPITPPAKAGREAFFTSQMALRALTAAAAPELLLYNIHIFGVCVGENAGEALVNQVKQLLNPDQTFPTGSIFQV